MKMNLQNIKTKAIIALVPFLIITGCSLIFEPEQISCSHIENYEQLIVATNGVYGQLNTAVNSDNFMVLNYNADDIFRGGDNYAIYYTIPKECLQGYAFTYTEEESPYATLYEVISSINNILIQFNLKELKNTETREILGELYFLRAYCYFRLVRTYGQIPLIEDVDVNFTVKRSGYLEIFEFIEADIFIAIDLLPKNKETGRYAQDTPNRGSAKALLAEVYLSWAGYPVKDNSKYELSAELASEVIDSAGFYGFELEEDFADLWNKSGEQTNESVFRISYSQIEANNSYLTLYNGLVQKRIEKSNMNGFTTDNLHFWNVGFSTEFLFYSNFPKDYRRDVTFFNHIYVPDEGPANFLQLDTGYFYIDQVRPCSRVTYQKFFLDTILLPKINSHSTLNNRYDVIGNPRIFLYRYAHSLLTYAEASARSGHLNEKSYECINQIRRRANHVDLFSPSEFDLHPGLSANAFADSVVLERAWELAGEPEGRWYDLLRLEKLEEVLRDTPDEDNFHYRRGRLENNFLPIPTYDRNLNPNLELN